MKIGFDIGGVLSKYPLQFEELIYRLSDEVSYERECDKDYSNIYIISDMHPKEQILKILSENLNIPFYSENVYCADYEKYGNMAKAILIKELGLGMFIDDFDGYLQWDSSLGPQPILLKVQPDAFKPYWADEWKCDGGDFGRRKYTQ